MQGTVSEWHYQRLESPDQVRSDCPFLWHMTPVVCLSFLMQISRVLTACQAHSFILHHHHENAVCLVLI